MPDGTLFPAIQWDAVGPLLLIALAIMGSPGPATISLVAAGSAYGVRGSLGFLAGVIVGTTLVLVAVATGITAALLALPALGPALIGVSAAFILWLAYRIALAPPMRGASPAVDAPSLAGGFLLGVANPKAWVGIAAVFESAHLAGDAAGDAAAKVIVLAALIVLIMPAWLVVGSSLAPVLREPRRARLVNATLAVVLVIATALAVGH